MHTNSSWSTALQEELIHFYQEAVRTTSYSDQEGNLAHLILKTMQHLDYDKAYIDPVGNVVGQVGNGDMTIHFDSHMDTVQAGDAASWSHPPFSGEIVDGMLWGRGAVDMKGGLAASVFAAAQAKRKGLLEGKRIYVTCSVCEEYCDGVCLEHFYRDSGVRPDVCVICEPSDNVITLGHTGKLQARIRAEGVSAHGSAPEKGVNAVYEMAQIIQRVEALNATLQKTTGGTIVLSDISCVSASLNAVPSSCEIYLDRRLRPGETLSQAYHEMDELIRGKRASWEIGTLRQTSWTGRQLDYTPAHEPWKISKEHPLTRCCADAYEAVFGVLPQNYNFWDFGTNAVVPVGMGIATIGFGPGDYKLAHMVNECCSVEKVKEAALFYTQLIAEL